MRQFCRTSRWSIFLVNIFAKGETRLQFVLSLSVTRQQMHFSTHTLMHKCITSTCDNHLEDLIFQVWCQTNTIEGILTLLIVASYSYYPSQSPLPSPCITPHPGSRLSSLPPSLSTSFITHHSHLTALTHSCCCNLEWTHLFSSDRPADTMLLSSFIKNKTKQNWLLIAFRDVKFCVFGLDLTVLFTEIGHVDLFLSLKDEFCLQFVKHSCMSMLLLSAQYRKLTDEQLCWLKFGLKFSLISTISKRRITGYHRTMNW